MFNPRLLAGAGITVLADAGSFALYTHISISPILLNEYNSERPHESLNNLTPEEYRLMAEKPEISKSVWN